MENPKIYKYVCPVCNKNIESIYKSQFEYNVRQHKDKHSRVMNNGNGKDTGDD